MSVSAVDIKDAANVTRAIAARNLSSVFYQMNDPEVLVARFIAVGSGDATVVSAVPVVVRAVRLYNAGAVACHAKLHNIAVAPTVGTTPVVYSAHAQAGQGNPDQRVAGDGMAFSVGLGVSLVTGIADNSTAAVVAGSAEVLIEYHLA